MTRDNTTGAGATPDGRIRVPADLDAVTAVGDEDHTGIDPSAVERIWQAVRHWYRAGMHPAIQVCVRHDGRVVLNRAIGHGWGNAPTDPPDARGAVRRRHPVLRVLGGQGDRHHRGAMLVDATTSSTTGCATTCPATPATQGPHHDPACADHSAGVVRHRPRPICAGWTTASTARAGNLKPLYRPGLVHIYHGVT